MPGSPPNFIRALGILLKMRLKMLLRPTGRGTAASGQRLNRTWMRYLILLVVVILLAFNVTARLVDVVGGPAGRLLLEAMLTFASSAASVALFLFAIPSVLAAFTYKSDLKLLLLTPVSPRLLLAEKFVGIYLMLSGLIVLIGAPILLGLGRALHLGPGYGIVAILVLLLLPIAPLGLALLIMVAVLRKLPARWARTITAVLGSVFGLAFYIGTQILTNGGGTAKTANLQRLFRQTPHAWWQSLPTTWPGQALSAAAQGQTGTTITYLVISLVPAAVLAVTGVLLAAHLFATGWATYQEVGTHRRTRAAIDIPPAEAPIRRESVPARTIAGHGVAGTEQLGLRQVWRPLWRKDWLNVRRDPQMLARLAYPLVIVVFGLYQTISKRSSGGSGMTHGANSVAFFITLAIYAYFLTNFLSARLVNREGRSLYLLALAPIGARDIFLVKWAFGALPIAALVEIILLIGSVFLHLSAGAVLLSIATFGCLVMAMVGGALTLSLVWPRLDWDNPSRQVSIQALLFTAVGGLILSAGNCALLAVVLGWASSRPLIALAAGLGIFVINGGVALISHIVGSQAMERLLHGGT